MDLEHIYGPIEKEMATVEHKLTAAMRESQNESILEMGDFLLASPGKRIRPALVILSAKAVNCGRSKGRGNNRFRNEALVKIATAMELIHIASLIHDDVLDKAGTRHNRPSINAKWGDEVSIALGDYIHSRALGLIGSCGLPDVFSCVSEAIHVMCEGELAQICQRGNMNLSKDEYIVIVKKKTATLFGASCQAGTMLGKCAPLLQSALKEYGLNFGMAFQITDDCRDLLGNERVLGKRPGQDIRMREITLPLLNLLEGLGKTQKRELRDILERTISRGALKKIQSMLIDSDALHKSRKTAERYINRAKTKLGGLPDSDYKESLGRLADYVIETGY
jgi:geranylgeranyl pyrophosphate synthase